VMKRKCRLGADVNNFVVEGKTPDRHYRSKGRAVRSAPPRPTGPRCSRRRWSRRREPDRPFLLERQITYPTSAIPMPLNRRLSRFRSRVTFSGSSGTGPGPVKWPTDVSHASENIPSHRHRAKTAREEQLLRSSFLSSFHPERCRLRTKAESKSSTTLRLGFTHVLM